MSMDILHICSLTNRSQLWTKIYGLDLNSILPVSGHWYEMPAIWDDATNIEFFFLWLDLPQLTMVGMLVISVCTTKYLVMCFFVHHCQNNKSKAVWMRRSDHSFMEWSMKFRILFAAEIWMFSRSPQHLHSSEYWAWLSFHTLIFSSFEQQ